METKADYVFESSWEVCNKVGGIYTVVKSKVRAMQEYYDNYFLIGPYFADKARDSFEEKTPPAFLKKAFKEMEDFGVKCYYGKWLVEGEPNTILLDAKDMKETNDSMKKWLWDNYRVDSLFSQWDFEHPMRWSWAVGNLMQHINKKKVVLHCHEWLAGFGLLYTKKYAPDIKTVFTTHATMLGRTIAGSGMELYDMLDRLNPEEMAKQLKVQDKYTTEKACAENADAFTTVSEITAMEAEKILGKKVDVVLNNGMSVEKFPTIEETTLMHVKNRNQVRDFLAYYFFPYYTFNLDHNLIYYTVGRFEFKNKGLDIIIDALKKLNSKLMKEKTDRTVTMIFWIPMSHKGTNQEIAENRNYFTQIKNGLQMNSESIMNSILYDLVAQKGELEESIFTSSYIDEIKKDLKHFHRGGTPPISTHQIVDAENNSVIRALLDAGLDNKEKNKVKVVVYPVYLDGDDTLLNLPYYQALSSGHLGIFPSYYEPWGYTPVESMSLGVPAVTTDLAGFGRFMKPHLLDENPGIWILERFGKTYEESMNGLYDIMLKFADYDHAERVQNKINAKQMSILSGWKHFAKNYVEAHNIALER